MKTSKVLPIIILTIVLAIVLSACGKPKTSGEAGTFGAAAEPTPVAADVKPSPVPSPDVKPSSEPTAANSTSSAEANQGENGSPKPSPTANGAVSTAVESKKEAEPTQAVNTPAPKTENPKPQPAEKKPESADSGNPVITWSQFFDDEKQNRPSERFWDLSEKRATVEMKGFMGEVLSFEKHWFLLIPQPGAECPFDNGDETYWNKIMIVFVPENINLRYTTGPLKITGRLDVGIKVDESGYKTMFRLYDAKFEKIKE